MTETEPVDESGPHRNSGPAGIGQGRGPTPFEDIISSPDYR